MSEESGRVGVYWYAYCKDDPLGYTDPSGLTGVDYANMTGDKILAEQIKLAEVYNLTTEEYDNIVQSAAVESAKIAFDNGDEKKAEEILLGLYYQQELNDEYRNNPNGNPDPDSVFASQGLSGAGEIIVGSAIAVTAVLSAPASATLAAGIGTFTTLSLGAGVFSDGVAQLITAAMGIPRESVLPIVVGAVVIDPMVDVGNNFAAQSISPSEETVQIPTNSERKGK